MTLAETIAAAEVLLPGRAAESGIDPRWQAIIEVAEFIPTNPQEVWAFAARWGCTEDADLRAAIATCIVEHLLEHHFEFTFTRIEDLARRDGRFVDTLKLCSNFGQADTFANRGKLQRLKEQLRG